MKTLRNVTPSTMKLSPILVCVTVVMLNAESVVAAKLSEIQVKSAIGEPFRGELVINDTSEDLEVKIGAAEQYKTAGLGYNEAAKLIQAKVIRQGKKAIVKLTSSQPIQEPYVDLVIATRSKSGEVTKTLTALIPSPIDSGTKAAKKSSSNASSDASTPSTRKRIDYNQLPDVVEYETDDGKIETVVLSPTVPDQPNGVVTKVTSSKNAPEATTVATKKVTSTLEETKNDSKQRTGSQKNSTSQTGQPKATETSSAASTNEKTKSTALTKTTVGLSAKNVPTKLSQKESVKSQSDKSSAVVSSTKSAPLVSKTEKQADKPEALSANSQEKGTVVSSTKSAPLVSKPEKQTVKPVALSANSQEKVTVVSSTKSAPLVSKTEKQADKPVALSANSQEKSSKPITVANADGKDKKTEPKSSVAKEKTQTPRTAGSSNVDAKVVVKRTESPSAKSVDDQLAPSNVATSKPNTKATITKKFESRNTALGGQFEVDAGRTLSGIASELAVKHKVSQAQMMAALFRANPQAFVDGDINRIKAGSSLLVPSKMEIQRIANGRQFELDGTQKQFRAYRNRLGTLSLANQQKKPKKDLSVAKGEIQSSQVAIAPLKKTNKDILRLTTPKNTDKSIILGEKQAAESRALADSKSKIENLTATNQDLQKLIELKKQQNALLASSVPGTAPALGLSASNPSSSVQVEQTASNVPPSTTSSLASSVSVTPVDIASSPAIGSDSLANTTGTVNLDSNNEGISVDEVEKPKSIWDKLMSWPALVAGALLSGLLYLLYRFVKGGEDESEQDSDRNDRILRTTTSNISVNPSIPVAPPVESNEHQSLNLNRQPVSPPAAVAIQPTEPPKTKVVEKPSAPVKDEGLMNLMVPDNNLNSELQKKYELALAYIEIGEKSGARNLLNEVLRDGDSTLKSMAQAALDKLSS